ncbi:MAG: hypothetical protein AAGI68_08425 [Planctomycetota bacterium]
MVYTAFFFAQALGYQRGLRGRQVGDGLGRLDGVATGTWSEMSWAGLQHLSHICRLVSRPGQGAWPLTPMVFASLLLPTLYLPGLLRVDAAWSADGLRAYWATLVVSMVWVGSGLFVGLERSARMVRGLWSMLGPWINALYIVGYIFWVTLAYVLIADSSGPYRVPPEPYDRLLSWLLVAGLLLGAYRAARFDGALDRCCRSGGGAE